MMLTIMVIVQDELNEDAGDHDHNRLSAYIHDEHNEDANDRAYHT